MTSLRIGDFVVRNRAIVGAILLIISAFFGYECTKVVVQTKFDDFFPSYHHDVQLYQEWHKYGGAQTLAVMVQVNKK